MNYFIYFILFFTILLSLPKIALRQLWGRPLCDKNIKLYLVLEVWSVFVPEGRGRSRRECILVLSMQNVGRAGRVHYTHSDPQCWRKAKRRVLAWQLSWGLGSHGFTPLWEECCRVFSFCNFIHKHGQVRSRATLRKSAKSKKINEKFRYLFSPSLISSGVFCQNNLLIQYLWRVRRKNVFRGNINFYPKVH